MNKNKLALLALASLTILGTSCTTKKVGEWSEWKEETYSRKYTYAPEEYKFSEGPELQYSSISGLSGKELYVPLNPRLSLEVQAFCDVTESRLLKRQKKHTSKTHYPLLDRTASKSGILEFYLDLAFGVLAYPFNYDSYKYNKEDVWYQREEKIEDDVSEQWVSASKLAEADRPSIRIPELEIEYERVQGRVSIPLSSYSGKLMTLDQLTVQLGEEDSPIEASVSLQGLQEQENLRNNRIIRYETELRVQEENRIAAEIAEQERVARALKERQDAFKEKTEAVVALEEAGDFAGALVAQRELIQAIQNDDTDYGVTVDELIEKALELAAQAGDLDAVSELMAL
ncbi:hypothetical protein P4E94_03455 [Pontiellaceae bacterium B12219]|nr:hypothetical protein [Pontiellaceae bacterium B12219]